MQPILRRTSIRILIAFGESLEMHKDQDLEAQRHNEKDAGSKSGEHQDSRDFTAKPVKNTTGDDATAMEDTESPSPTPAGDRSSISSHSSAASSDERPPASGSQVEESKEDANLFLFSEELKRERPPAEPWYMEMTRLRRMYFLYLNKRLAQCRKKILARQEVSDEDMLELKELLRDQGRS